jgi:hypothetical protein
MSTSTSARAILGAAVLLVSLTGCFGTTDSSPGPTPTVVADSPSPTPSPTPEPIVDGGARDMARGTATANIDGSLTYTVVAGDVGGVICDRFGLSGQQLQNDDGNGTTCYVVIEVGDTLNLSKERPGEGEG